MLQRERKFTKTTGDGLGHGPWFATSGLEDWLVYSSQEHHLCTWCPRCADVKQGILFSAIVANVGSLSGSLSCSSVSVFQKERGSFTNLYTCLPGHPHLPAPLSPHSFVLRTQISGAKVTLGIPPSLLPLGGLRLLMLLHLGPEGQNQSLGPAPWSRDSLCNGAGPHGGFLRQVSPISSASAPLKYLDNRVR